MSKIWYLLRFGEVGWFKDFSAHLTFVCPVLFHPGKACSMCLIPNYSSMELGEWVARRWGTERGKVGGKKAREKVKRKIHIQRGENDEDQRKRERDTAKWIGKR